MDLRRPKKLIGKLRFGVNIKAIGKDRELYEENNTKFTSVASADMWIDAMENQLTNLGYQEIATVLYVVGTKHPEAELTTVSD